jgi:hypothetical protein
VSHAPIAPSSVTSRSVVSPVPVAHVAPRSPVPSAPTPVTPFSATSYPTTCPIPGAVAARSLDTSGISSDQGLPTLYDDQIPSERPSEGVSEVPGVNQEGNPGGPTEASGNGKKKAQRRIPAGEKPIQAGSKPTARYVPSWSSEIRSHPFVETSAFVSFALYFLEARKESSRYMTTRCLLRRKRYVQICVYPTPH